MPRARGGTRRGGGTGRKAPYTASNPDLGQPLILPSVEGIAEEVTAKVTAALKGVVQQTVAGELAALFAKPSGPGQQPGPQLGDFRMSNGVSGTQPAVVPDGTALPDQIRPDSMGSVQVIAGTSDAAGSATSTSPAGTGLVAPGLKPGVAG